jgi:hypothetical protein
LTVSWGKKITSIFKHAIDLPESKNEITEEQKNLYLQTEKRFKNKKSHLSVTPF